jgi:SWI/SNF-related matrix-associated actin-dependent regulator of chromatin subfamily A-like protein 1
MSMEIQFDFDKLASKSIWSIPGRKFHRDTNGKKYCTCPVSIEAVQILQSTGWKLDEYLVNFLSDSLQEHKQLKKELFPFQKDGVAFIEKKNGRALIGDEMGLGKTIQALAWLHLHPEKKPVVIVCPAHLKLNWAKEIAATLPGKKNVQVLYGDTPSKITGDILIINYDILPNNYEKYKDSAGKKRYRELKRTGWVDFLIDIKPEVLIIDEAHYCKSTSAFRTKGTRKLAKKCKHVIALTGTPIINRPIEGFYIVQLIDKTLFPNFWTYVTTYCDAKHNGFGWDFSGASNQEKLYKTLQNVMIRRKKKEVLKELPDKIYSYVPMEITNAKEYKAAEADFISYLRREKGEEAAKKAKAAEHLVRIEALKQLAVKGIMSQVLQWIQEFIDGGNEKLVIFAVHKTVIEEIMNKFKKCAVKIDGSISAIDRDNAVEAFQNNEKIRLLIGNIQAAGTGLTLTAASSEAFIELPWSPGDLVQAEDRCHRIGQKNTVNIYYLLASNTIEMMIVELLDSKRKTITAVLDGEEVDETKLLFELIKQYTK